MKFQAIMNIMEQLAPRRLAEDWDNPGLLVGSPKQDVGKLLVCLDVTEEVVMEAVYNHCDMIISHHPVIFKGMKKLRTDLYQGRLFQKLLINNIAVFSAHTNLDAAVGGVNDVLARAAGLERIRAFDSDSSRPMEETVGRIGYLPEPMTIDEFAAKLKAGLGAEYVRVVRAGDKIIRKVALCSGAGAEFISRAAFLGADCYITGDVKYHDAQLARENEIHVIDGGHFPTEFPVVKVLAELISAKAEEAGERLEIICDTASRDVFEVI